MGLPENTEAAQEYQDRVEAPDRNLTGEDLDRLNKATCGLDSMLNLVFGRQITLTKMETPQR